MEIKAGATGLRKRRAGFTLLETLAAMLLMITVVALLISRPGPNPELAGETALMISDLRFAQSLAMTSEAAWSVDIQSGTYTLLRDGAAAPLTWPNRGGATHTLATGVVVSQGTGMLNIDRMGSPGSTTRTITLSAGSESSGFTLSAGTGYIP